MQLSHLRDYVNGLGKAQPEIGLIGWEQVSEQKALYFPPKRRHRNKLQQFRWVAASNLNSKVRKNDLFLVVDDVPIPGTTKTEPVGALIPAIL
jgi:hypothetical protein